MPRFCAVLMLLGLAAAAARPRPPARYVHPLSPTVH